MAMSRMTYNAVAAMIAGERAQSMEPRFGSIPRFFVLQTTRNLAFSMASMFAADNPRFDKDKFFEACGISNPHHRNGGEYHDPDTGEDF